MSEPEPLEISGHRYGKLTAVAGVDITVRAGALYAVLLLFADRGVFLRRDLAEG